jgi:uncharacterized protein (DUF433 family)
MAAQMTTAEVAALTELDERAIRKDVEECVVNGMSSPPRFDMMTVVYFKVRATFEKLVFPLRRQQRAILYFKVVSGLREKASTIDLGYLKLDLKTAQKDVETNMERFDEWKSTRIDVDASILGGEPVFRKTRLAVRNVGKMVIAGVSKKEILEDYPYLSEDDLKFATLYTIAYPSIGRPRDQTSPR